jgi:hypothetical protein
MDHGSGAMDHGGGLRITSFDDPQLTDAQRSKAKALYDSTVSAMKKFTDVASVEAAGYETIGDAISGFEHFINYAYRADGRELDPEHIESMVFETKPGQPKKLAAGMYILNDGKTMKDVPEIAGTLTTWHLHDDLCWDAAGKKVVGNYRQGRCIPAGALKETPPMLHIWPEPQRCGPFAEADTSNPIDSFLNRGVTTTTMPGADPCQHVHSGAAAPGSSAGGAAATGAGAAGAAHNHSAMPARLDHDPTEEQKTAARKLIADVKRDTTQYADVNAAVAAGYVSIRDAMTGVEHFVNADYYNDKDILDTKRIESLVYKVLPDGGRQLITAMFIMPEGTTADDIPDVAGNLTLWHNHTNLCWDEKDPRKLAGVQLNGKCTPAGVYRETPVMFHVWVTDNDCGPFAGTDGGQMTGSCVKFQ